jgi:uncharacterized protein DUF6152
METDMKNSTAKAVLLAVFAITAQPGLAHHSFAMFDQEKVITLQGTVKEFQWTNPHSWIQVLVPGEADKVTEWSVEMGGPGGLARKGWKPRTLKQGDKVTIVIHPLRDGGPGGSFVSVVLPSGQTMGGDQFRVAK